jgi:hypothetical protein
LLGLAAFSLSFAILSLAQTPDNTAMNKGNPGTATADQQKENAADGNLAWKIRQSLFLSTPITMSRFARNSAIALEPPREERRRKGRHGIQGNVDQRHRACPEATDRQVPLLVT